MRLATTYDNGQINQHFGHTEYFKIYEIEDGKVLDSKVVSTNGSGHGALAGFLAEAGVAAIICGGIGMGAQQALAEAGIVTFAGVEGDADEIVNLFLSGRLSFSREATCSHHHDGEEHNCGEHGCGNNGCGNHGCK